MIFKQVKEIVAGTKTQTRRVAKSNTTLTWDGNGPAAVKTWKYEGANRKTIRTKWCIGQDYAVVPKMNHPACWYNHANGEIYGHGYNAVYSGMSTNLFILPLRYKILSIHREPLQAISRDDAKREGVNDVGEYRKLWESINKASPHRWADNPFVWVIDFEVLKTGGNK